MVLFPLSSASAEAGPGKGLSQANPIPAWGAVDVLQFCDLLSLYLCCGAPDNVEFPQRFCDRAIRIFRESEVLRTEPRVFGVGVSLGVQARRYSASSDDLKVTTLPFILA